ncbi:MAG: zinc ribbon domain-containing protein [Proteobacteria bacterium]|nr:zinc ribbon domain-containing protein [Pseudomonadota bacterium]MBU1138384.1 zinc ribbon domain-containing protein [Pseudomonadota bacterium]MBU1231621.1 zinc ribbon domain-containing protein [Pseudomonadota bacterium]MBU1419207.1 zinc ribbon domain-containing protein [Pseudomonadota bacterium]MBU1454915.1 zinc ribbon domain-containing protein [Pseudomonadota bacterium]
MPVYEYECPTCETVFEVQQRMADDPLSKCPECEGAVKKIVSRSSFQLKGGGWYADGYSSSKVSESKASSSSPSPCKSGDSCANCPAATAT